MTLSSELTGTQLFYILNASYTSSTAFIKLSLLFQYLRVVKRGTFTWKICVFLIIIISLWGFAFSFMAWVPCFPIHKYWDYMMRIPGKCYGFGISTDRTTFVIYTSINMVLDLTVFAIPITLFQRDLSLKSRVGMVILVLMGCL